MLPRYGGPLPVINQKATISRAAATLRPCEGAVVPWDLIEPIIDNAGSFV